MLDRTQKTLSRHITKKVNALNPPTIDEYIETRKIVEDPLRYIFDLHTVMRDVTSALLTHISAMIAVLGVMLIVFQDTTYTKYFVMIEMSLYSALALMCIFNMRWSGFVNARNDMTIERYYFSYLKNRYLYQRITDGVIWVTLFFIVTILGHIIHTALT